MSQPSNSTTSQPPHQSLVSIELNATDLLGAVGFLLAAVIGVLFKRLQEAGRQLQAFQRPNLFLPRDLSRVNQLLSQLAILVGADRVILGVFHNGILSPEGFHLSRLQCVAAYLRPGVDPVSELYRIIPTDNIPELKDLFLSEKGTVAVDRKNESITAGCRMYLDTRNIKCLRNIMLKAGEVETGVISCHYVREIEACPTEAVFETEEVKAVLQELERLTLLKNKHPSMIAYSQYQR